MSQSAVSGCASFQRSRGLYYLAGTTDGTITQLVITDNTERQTMNPFTDRDVYYVTEHSRRCYCEQTTSLANDRKSDQQIYFWNDVEDLLMATVCASVHSGGWLVSTPIVFDGLFVSGETLDKYLWYSESAAAFYLKQGSTRHHGFVAGRSEVEIDW